MGAWNFKREFKGKILSHEKCSTFRAYRKDGRDPDAGCRQLLFTGLRTKCVERLAEVKIITRQHALVATDHLVLTTLRKVEDLGDSYRRYFEFRAPSDLRAFALFDGFRSWQELVDFFAIKSPWVGYRYEWDFL